MVNEAGIAAKEEGVMDTSAELSDTVLEALRDSDLGGSKKGVSVG